MKTKLFSIIILSFILITFSCDNGKKEIQKIKTTADSLFKAGNYEDAKIYYSKILKKQPKNKYAQTKVNEINAFLENAKKEQDEVDYQTLLQEADRLFDEENYSEAKLAYERLLQLKPDESFLSERFSDCEAKLPQTNVVNSSNDPYHIIVGCFMYQNNATRLQQKMNNKGLQSNLISIGRLTAVTYSSHATLRDAYNKLSDARNDANQYDAWIMKYNN